MEASTRNARHWRAAAWVAGSALVAAMLILGSALNPYDSGVPRDAPLRVRLAYPAEWYGEGLRSVAELYDRARPDVNLKLEPYSSRNFAEIYREALRDGDAPEIAIWRPENEIVPGLLDWSESLLRANPYIDPTRPWREFMPSEALAWVETKAGLHWIPIDRADFGFLFNATLFRKLGLDVPATWGDLVHACQTFKDAGYIPLAWDANDGPAAAALFTVLMDAALRPFEADINFELDQPGVASSSMGQFEDLGERIDPDEVYVAYKRGLFDAEAPSIRFAYEKFADLVPFFQPRWVGAPADESLGLFLEQKAAMTFRSMSALDEVRTMVRLTQPADRQWELSAFPVPVLTVDQAPFRLGATRSAGGFGSGWCCSIARRIDPARREVARDFVNFLMAPRHYEKVYAEGPQPGLPLYPGIPVDPGLGRFAERGRAILGLEGVDAQFQDEWNLLVQQYYAGRMDSKQMGARLDRIYRDWIGRLIRQKRINREWLRHYEEAAS